MNPSTTFSTRAGQRGQADVVPFAPAPARRFRREADPAAAPLGRILLFTGVRYERMPEAETEASLPQRRRS